jgi:CBS domain containing-hemolysin-like protein
MSTGTALTLSLFLLVLNAFFVGAEFALISARRTAIEPRAQAGGRAAGITLAAMERVSLMMACAQLGITVCSLGLGYLGEPAIAHLLEGPFEDVGLPESLVHPVAFTLALGLIGYLHVVLGEMVPKNIALAGPDRAALLLAPPLVLIARALGPVIRLLNWLANRVLLAAGVTPKDEVTSAFTRDEVAGLVEESHREGLLDESEEQLVAGALNFEEQDARTVLLPLYDLETVSSAVTPQELEQLAARTGFSRFPVRGQDDGLSGYLHLKDALEFEDVHRTRPIAPSWIRPLPTVGSHDRLRSVLAKMQRSGAHLALVRCQDTDEPLGVVALEDVVEELVGEIRDEAGTQARSGPRARQA